MAKKLINLLIEIQPEPAALKYLKKILPLLSISSLIIFVLLHIASLVYVRLNIDDYNKIKGKVDEIEKKISNAKGSESLYISSIAVLGKIDKILAGNSKIIETTLPVILNIQNSDISLGTVMVDNSGQVGLTLKTSDSQALENMASELVNKQNLYNFKDIKAAGIVRENDGSYSLSISLNVDKKI